MSFEDTFCPSPWFSVVVKQDGNLRACRWGTSQENISPMNIATTGLIEFHRSKFMSEIRAKLLNGTPQALCSHCDKQGALQQVSGRERQLLKFGIRKEDYLNTLRSSERIPDLVFSAENNGDTTMMPVDLQINLGNFCNNSCIMCDPISSSRVASDYRKLSKTNPIQFFNPPRILESWAQDPSALAKFIDELITIPNIRYIHFLGGETLIHDSFYKICDALITAGLSKSIIIGTTTNGTMYDDRLDRICEQFQEFHLGFSIETNTTLNDYIRYGSDLNSVMANCGNFLRLRSTHPNLNFIFRTTLNLFTIYHFDELVRFMLANNIAIESCFILSDPKCLRVELLPETIKYQIIQKLNDVIEHAHVAGAVNTSVNVRLSGTEQQQVLRYTHEMISLLSSTLLDDEEIEVGRRDLVKFIKSFESIRHNTILDYIPEYEEFLRSYGY